MPNPQKTVKVIATASGRQLNVAIPKMFAEAMGIQKGDNVTWELRGEELVFIPVTP